MLVLLLTNYLKLSDFFQLEIQCRLCKSTNNKLLQDPIHGPDPVPITEDRPDPTLKTLFKLAPPGSDPDPEQVMKISDPAIKSRSDQLRIHNTAINIKFFSFPVFRTYIKKTV